MSIPVRRWVGPYNEEVLVTYQEVSREDGPRCNCPEETWANTDCRDPEYHEAGCPWGEFWLERK